MENNASIPNVGNSKIDSHACTGMLHYPQGGFQIGRIEIGYNTGQIEGKY